MSAQFKMDSQITHPREVSAKLRALESSFDRRDQASWRRELATFASQIADSRDPVLMQAFCDTTKTILAKHIHVATNPAGHDFSGIDKANRIIGLMIQAVAPHVSAQHIVANDRQTMSVVHDKLSTLGTAEAFLGTPHFAILNTGDFANAAKRFIAGNNIASLDRLMVACPDVDHSYKTAVQDIVRQNCEGLARTNQSELIDELIKNTRNKEIKAIANAVRAAATSPANTRAVAPAAVRRHQGGGPVPFGIAAAPRGPSP